MESGHYMELRHGSEIHPSGGEASLRPSAWGCLGLWLALLLGLMAGPGDPNGGLGPPLAAPAPPPPPPNPTHSLPPTPLYTPLMILY